MVIATPDHIKRTARFHTKQSKYGAQGGIWARGIQSIFDKIGAKTCLDYGAGKAVLSHRLHGTVAAYDPCVDGINERPTEASDIVICSNVLQYVEPDCLFAVMQDVKSLANTAVFFVIEAGPSRWYFQEKMGGKNARLIQMDLSWWYRQIKRTWPDWSTTNFASGDFKNGALIPKRFKKDVMTMLVSKEEIGA